MLSEKADGKMAKAGLMPKTTKERSQELRARRRKAGLVEITIGPIGSEKGLRVSVTQDRAREIKQLLRAEP